jgi:hypothetical protein
MGRCVSFSSQLYHFLAYSIKKPKMQLENGMLIISIDVDVGSSKLGLINKGKNDANVHNYFSEYRIGEIEELALPLFIETFNDFEIPVTFAIRGQLTEVNDSILGLLLKSPIKHDIGAHGYYHREFTDLSRTEAENELNMISAGMKKFGVIPRSFVFPRGSVAHLDLLARNGYKCYRGYGDFIHDCMYIERKEQLYNINPSLYLDEGANLLLLRKIIDISIARKLPFHLWFHLWNFGETEEAMKKIVEMVLRPFFGYLKRKERNGALSFETMLSAALRIERDRKSNTSFC